MGLYDVNLKKTNIGYQFDRNVYIGIQTNDNRVVTFKDLGNPIVASGGAGGGEDIQLEVSSIESIGSSDSFVDHIAFKRNGRDVAYDILPQYVRAATPEDDKDLSQGKVCLLMPVYEGETEQDPGTLMGYKLYATDQLSMETLQLVIGNTTYTYNGSSAVTVNFSTIPTVAASSIEIATSIPTTGSGNAIPTVEAVRNYASTGTLSHSLNFAGSNFPETVSFTGATTTTVSGGDHIVGSVSTSAAGTQINLNTTHHYTIQESDLERPPEPDPENPLKGTILSLELSAKLRSHEWSFTLPRKITGFNYDVEFYFGGVYEDYIVVYCLALNMGAMGVGLLEKTDDERLRIVNAAPWLYYEPMYASPGFGEQVTLGYISGESVSFTMPSLEIMNATLNWGSSVSYAAISGVTHYLTLPSVNTIPTVAASSTEITSTVNSSSTAAQIPTAAAVWAAVSAAPGTVTAISMNGSSYTPASGVVTLPTYALTDHTITIGSASVTVPEIIDVTNGVNDAIKNKVSANPTALLKSNNYIYVPQYDNGTLGLPTYYNCFEGDENLFRWLTINWGSNTITYATQTYFSDHQSIKKLNTTATATQATNASEAIAGSGTITLHKISKTGSYNDLLNVPSTFTPSTHSHPEYALKTAFSYDNTTGVLTIDINN